MNRRNRTFRFADFLSPRNNWKLLEKSTLLFGVRQTIAAAETPVGRKNGWRPSSCHFRL